MPVYKYDGASLNHTAYKVDGSLLAECYDIAGNELFGSVDEIVTNDDSSTGTSSGYSLTSDSTSKAYVLRMLANFISDSGSFQSFGYDYDNGLYYRFDASTTVKAYNQNGEKVQTITMPQSAGHNNDAAYYNGNFYMPSLGENSLYVWNISGNVVSTIPVTGIQQPLNGSIRKDAALCEKNRGSKKLYIVCQDFYTTDIDHQADDKMTVYEYDLDTQVATLKADYPWDCVYIQGATCFNGILYVACNTQTTGAANNYKGITIKCIRTDTWELFDELVCAGNFEPEGMDVVPVVNGYELMVGMGHWGTMRQAVRFTPPYELKANEKA